jgi:RNA polymerase sigma-70 factor (ECF subfamily)
LLNTQTFNLANEKELLSAVAEGDERAFKVLFDGFWNLVYTNTLTLVRSVPLAEDLSQEVFFKVWQHREKLIGVDNFKKYLYTITRNTVISEFRKKIIAFAENAPEDIVDTYKIPTIDVELKETYRLILDGIESLPAKQKNIFRMSRFEYLSHEEIAQKMNISKETVKWHIVTSLNFLKKYLHERNASVLFLLILTDLMVEVEKNIF